MFESFKAVCYVPLIIFAIGWAVSQAAYISWRRSLSAGNGGRAACAQVLRSSSDILMAGLISVILVLSGIRFGLLARWFALGISVLLIMGNVARLGAAIEFAAEKMSDGKYRWFRLAVMPCAVRLACYLLAEVWMIYVFYVAGLF
ncbi:hypothetical protein [Enterocloster lavalensis]|uniref:hypothetical protein n=1 Tax=Enterocloster lavalensis TaxID=460384 RepID=UPI0023EFB3E5|nr:hypothetical protein [Enterocloster lavalensis]